MVKIAIAGGTGSVASEIVDALVATKKHDILILTRSDPSSKTAIPGVTYAQTDYSSVDDLTELFKGTHTVLSFLAAFDQESGIASQKCIIDACVKAGVKRLAPSEWVMPGLSHTPWYAFKDAARTYLAELNKDKKVLEYCLFQLGYFTNYLARPTETATHVKTIDMPFDFENKRMLIAEGSEDAYTTWTTVRDLQEVVCRAVEYEGVWPVVGGIRGSRITMGELVKLGEKVRGGAFNVERIAVTELESQTYSTSWHPEIEHASIPQEMRKSLTKMFVSGILLAVRAGDFDGSDEWNRLLPDYEFEGVEKFLGKVWEGKEGE